MPGPGALAERTFGALTRAIVLGLMCCLLVSCGSAAPPRVASPSDTASALTSPSSTATDRQIQSTLDALVTAIRGHDRVAFDRLISRRDPDFAAAAMRIFDNLSGSPLKALTLQLRPRQHELTPARLALLGAGATTHAVAVDWALRGDTGSAEHQLWFTFVETPTPTLAATSDGPTERVAQPCWMLEPLVGQSIDRTTLLVGHSGSIAGWARQGNAAVAAVRPRLPPDLRRRWNGDLVLELPSTREVFEQILGVSPGSYATIGAVAWPEGPDPATAALRIVVNPALADRLDDQGLAILLAHEATHIATRSADTPAPTWLVEGFADYVAYDAYPTTAMTAAALVADVKAHGVPTELPADSAFSPSAPDLALSYAKSWLACRFLAETFSATRLAQFYAEVDRGSSVDRASRQVFGLDQSRLVADSGRYLRALAEHS